MGKPYLVPRWYGVHGASPNDGCLEAPPFKEIAISLQFAGTSKVGTWREGLSPRALSVPCVVSGVGYHLHLIYSPSPPNPARGAQRKPAQRSRQRDPRGSTRGSWEQRASGVWVSEWELPSHS